MQQIISTANNMNGLSKSLSTQKGVTLTSLVAVVVVLSFSQVSSQSNDAFCVGNNSIELVIDHNLPISHPANRCATQQSQGVSWASWFSGRSSSYQFHFIDLLELLSRDTDNNANNPTKAN